MKIQLICSDPNKSSFGEIINQTSFLDKAHVLDDYDVNIIDLKAPSIWRNKKSNYQTIDQIKDFKTLNNLLNNAKTSTSIVLLPSDLEFLYTWDGRSYSQGIKIKDMLAEFHNILLQLYLVMENVVFGVTTTKFGSSLVNSDFYFSPLESTQAITKTDSGIVTTIKTDRVLFTTLQICNNEELELFLQICGLSDKEEVNIPDWFGTIEMFDDNEQKKLINESKKIIDIEKEKIYLAEKQLQINNKRKSILYTQGNELAETVLSILDEIFCEKISDFVDEKKEDFRFEYNDKIVIGEIKGLSHCVKMQNISQVDNHVLRFMDDNPENQKPFLPILIINHQREKKPKDREPIHENQIRIAIKREVRIIETCTLLNIYEGFLQNKISKDDLWNCLIKKTGLIKYDDMLHCRTPV